MIDRSHEDGMGQAILRDYQPGSPSAESGRAEILACPFCGGEAFMGADDAGYPEVKCIGECHPADTEAEAIAAWNRRTPDRALLDCIEELEAVVAEVDRLGLVIESAVRRADSGNLAHIHALMKLPAMQAAATARRKALSGEKP